LRRYDVNSHNAVTPTKVGAQSNINNVNSRLGTGLRRYDVNGRHTRAVTPAKAGAQSHFMNKLPCVYIMASERNGTLYVGVTSDLAKRVWEHKNNVIEGFTKKYSVHTLVWYQVFETMLQAIRNEKQFKEWKREWKLELIESLNPDWRDLYEDIM
jgi:putative endonuclease